MTVTSQLKNKVDLPTWEWLRFAPTATQSLSCTAYGDGMGERYIYYITGTIFYRYDIITDTYQQLASPPTAIVTAASMRYTSLGYRGNILSAGTNTAVIAGLENGVLGSSLANGYKIRITSGTGMGQPDRTIITCGDTVTKDHGVVTAATANVLTDSVKKWTLNQWAGYQVRVVFNTGASQVRKVLYNDATNLYFYDINYQRIECWNNTPFSGTAPYVVPVATAGVQSHYFIEQSTITLDAAWTVQPDNTSSYVVLSGGIWLLSSVAVAPWSSLQFYDIMSDTWTTKTALGGLLLAALGTDWSIERTGEAGGIFINGTTTTGGARSIADTSKTMLVDRYANYQLRITGGTGIGQKRRIVQNSATTFIVELPWVIAPDATSTYSVYGNTDRIYLSGNGNASIYKYNIEVDEWFQGNSIDAGQTINMSAKINGQEPFAITSGVRNTGGITTVNPVPTVAGTGYAVGDVLNVTTGGTVGKVRVTSVNAGVVTGIELYSCGLTYTIGTGKATTNVIGVGTGCTIEITAIGTVGRITTVQNVNLSRNDIVTFAGCTETLWNAAYTIVGIDALTTFDVVTTATATMVASNVQSTSVLVDASKNWAVNEHVGKLLSINTVGPAPTTQVRRITANTATTCTLQSVITTAVNGTSRYVLHQPQAFGKDEQYKVLELNNNGKATSGSTTTITDTSKIWLSNQWAGYKFRVNSGTGVGSEIAIISNTPNTLTFSAQAFTPDVTTDYIIMDSFGLATAGLVTTLTDTTKNWAINQWAGKRCKITSGTGMGQEFTIASNTATVLTFTAITTAPSTDSTYSILGAPVRSTGIEVNWIYGNSNVDTKGKYLYIPRGGGSNIIDRYDITSELWDYTLFISPQSEVLNTGTMWAYDGGDRLYFTINATGRVSFIDVSRNKVDGCGLIPYAMGAAIIGNRMEIAKTDDGLYYLYIFRHTGQEVFRSLIFW